MESELFPFHPCSLVWRPRLSHSGRPAFASQAGSPTSYMTMVNSQKLEILGQSKQASVVDYLTHPWLFSNYTIFPLVPLYLSHEAFAQRGRYCPRFISSCAAK
jgi:hypothetical protein